MKIRESRTKKFHNIDIRINFRRKEQSGSWPETPEEVFIIFQTRQLTGLHSHVLTWPWGGFWPTPSWPTQRIG